MSAEAGHQLSQLFLNISYILTNQLSICKVEMFYLLSEFQ